MDREYTRSKFIPQKPEIHLRTTLLRIKSLSIIKHEPVNFPYGMNCYFEKDAKFTDTLRGDTAEFFMIR